MEAPQGALQGLDPASTGLHLPDPDKPLNAAEPVSPSGELANAEPRGPWDTSQETAARATITLCSFHL